MEGRDEWAEEAKVGRRYASTSYKGGENKIELTNKALSSVCKRDMEKDDNRKKRIFLAKGRLRP